MKPHWLVTLVLTVPMLAAAAAAAETKQVLYFTKSAGFEHSVVKRGADGLSFSEKLLAEWGPKRGYEFTFSKDGSQFTPEYLKQFDAFLFYTTGDLLSVGTDGHPAMTAAGKQALFDAISAGKGFVGLHSASDTFHTGETGGGNPAERSQRYRNYGDAADSYIKMLGGEFIRHGPQQVATARVVDPKFPGFEQLGAELEVMEEWYSLKEFAPNLHVQLVMETEGMQGPEYERSPYPLAWARSYGDGRVAYNAMGHREDVWESEAFQSMLFGVLDWATGRVDADITPNLQEAAPGHAAIPPQPQPKK